VALAELAPSYTAGSPSFLLLVFAFGIFSAFLSLIFAVNDIKSLIEVCRGLRMFKNNNNLIHYNKIPMLKFTLKLDKLKYGISLR
jgi:hypothetical protein